MFQAAKQHVVLITASTVLAGISLASIILFTDPYSIGIITLILFYLSLFLFSLGLVSLVGLFIRHQFSKSIYIVNLSSSFRQGIFIGLLITASLFLRSKGLLYWWVELGLILFLTALEIFLNLKV